MALPALSPRIDGKDEHLVAKPFGNAADQCGIVDGCGVDAYFVRAAAKQRIDILRGAYAAAYGQRDENLLSSPAHHIHHGMSVGARSRHIEERQLVSALPVVFRSKFHRIAGVAKILEMHAFDHSSRIYIKTWNDSDRQ